jgi:energy-coupling factor transport system substrate-specific component
MLALAAQRSSPRQGGLLTRLLRARRRDGSWEGLVNRTAFGVLALRAARTGDRQVRSAVRWLGREANRDGGFAFSGRGAASGIDDTAGAVQALAAAGHRRGPTVRRAARFIMAHQNPDGGFPLQPGGASNAQSTAWAIQALLAAGRDPDGARRGGARSPLAYLRSLTAGDGSVRYSRTSRQTPVWVTAQAITALRRRTFPIRAR